MFDFQKSVKDNCKALLEDVDKKCHSIVFQLFTSIVRLSPSKVHFINNNVPTGLFANQWYPKVGGFSTELNNSTSPNGSDSLARINSLTNKRLFLGKDNVVTLSNNLHYGELIERLGWQLPQWPGKAKPYRMIERSLQIVKARNP